LKLKFVKEAEAFKIKNFPQLIGNDDMLLNFEESTDLIQHLPSPEFAFTVNKKLEF
jgi:hypothetical protein